ncbi:hypothetical protein [Saccharothrix syringae]|nr:hypothetical protein [Saccharothrix syringae]
MLQRRTFPAGGLSAVALTAAGRTDPVGTATDRADATSRIGH